MGIFLFGKKDDDVFLWCGGCIGVFWNVCMECIECVEWCLCCIECLELDVLFFDLIFLEK